MKTPRCSYLRGDGRRCPEARLDGSTFCETHAAEALKTARENDARDRNCRNIELRRILGTLPASMGPRRSA